MSKLALFRKPQLFQISIVLFILCFLGCLPKKSVEEMDNFLSQSWSIEESDFENFSFSESEEDFFYGLKIYSLVDETNIEKFADQLESIQNDVPDDLFYLTLANAKIQRLKGEATKSIELVEELLKKDSSNKWVIYETAQQTNIDSERIIICDKLISMYPEFYRAKILKAYSLDASIDYVKVIELIESETLPLDPELYSYLADAYLVQGSIERSEKLLKQSIGIRPTINAYLSLSDLYNYYKGDLKSAHFFLKEAAKIDSTDFSYLSTRGWLFFDEGKNQDANNSFRILLANVEKLDKYRALDVLEYYTIIGDTSNVKSSLNSLRLRLENNFYFEGYDFLNSYPQFDSYFVEWYLERFRTRNGEGAYEWLVSKMNLLEYDIPKSTIRSFEVN
jgi:tetratricopeptide (TPR) repeat protein